MSTRAVIARKTTSGFTGVYHHWDGYPTGLGATLFALFNGHFQRDVGKMLAYLIDDHPAGWSTINGADFNLTPGFRKDESEVACATCGEVHWKHYAQNYAAHGLPTPEHPPGDYRVFGHAWNPPEIAQAPECYCHGGRNEEGNTLTEKNAQACGCEWAYVFDGPKMLVLSSYHPTGGKMIGMFGCGNPNAKWYQVGEVDLASQEPDWKAIENFEPVQPVLN